MQYSKFTKSWSPFQNDIALVVGVAKRGTLDSDNELEVCLAVSWRANAHPLSYSADTNIQGHEFTVVIPATELVSVAPSEKYFRDDHEPSAISGLLWLLKKGHYHTE